MLFRSEIPKIEEITEFCRSHLMRKNDFFIAALSLAVALYNECENVSFTWTWNGRQKIAEVLVAGFFIRDLPVALKTSSKMKLADFLKACEKQVSLGIKHGRCSYGMTGKSIDDAICFLYQDNIYDASKIDMGYEIIAVPKEEAYEILEIELLDNSEGAAIIYGYDGGKYKEESMKRFAALFLTVCDAFLETSKNSEMTIGDIKQ